LGVVVTGREDLVGRTAIVTGGSRGIGLAAAQGLAARGANVVITSRTTESADAAADAAGERVWGFPAHVTDEDAAHRCVEFAIDRFGSLDILVNNAGTNPAHGPLMQQDHGRFSKTLDVNLWAPLLWTRLAWEAWMGEHGGAVVNTSSLGAYLVDPGLGVYQVSKAALVHLTKHLAVELGPRVRVNGVAPGLVRTKLAEGLWREHEDKIASVTPLGRIGEPDDIAGAIAFLATDDAAWITGETLLVDGGTLLGRR
jgi:NAD(P)-dependent dehydrogenase (short-subunit alcohol dehydrogenase family)